MILAGTVVTCEGGHEVCEFVRNVMAGESVYALPNMVGNFRDGQIAPRRGDIIDDLTCHCGAVWIRRAGYGAAEVHVAGKGWTG